MDSVKHCANAVDLQSVKQFVRRKTGGLISYRDIIKDEKIVERVGGKLYINHGNPDDLVAYLLNITSELVSQCTPCEWLYIKMYVPGGKTYTNVLNCDEEITDLGVAFWFSSHPDVIKYIKDKNPENFEIIDVKDDEKIYIIVPNDNAGMVDTVFLIVSDGGKVFQI